MLPAAFEPFVKEAPFGVMTRAPLQSLCSRERLDELCRIHKARAAFAIRQHGPVEGRLVGKRRYAGRTETGEVYEQHSELSYEGRVQQVRRITVVRAKPTRDGDTERHLRTTLSSNKATALGGAEL
jgi:hypothetical protein